MTHEVIAGLTRWSLRIYNAHLYFLYYVQRLWRLLPRTSLQQNLQLKPWLLFLDSTEVLISQRLLVWGIQKQPLYWPENSNIFLSKCLDTYSLSLASGWPWTDMCVFACMHESVVLTSHLSTIKYSTIETLQYIIRGVGASWEEGGGGQVKKGAGIAHPF